MRSFKIEHETVSSRTGKILRRGDVVLETNFVRANISSLISRGFISEVDPNKPIFEIEKPSFQLSKTNKPKWKKRLAIVTAVWKRPEIFEMFANATKKLNHPELDIIVIVSGSEGDTTKRMVEKHDFIYIEIPNEPLASKHNACTLTAGELNCDYVLCVGSDDIITNELLEIYVQYMNKQIDYVGVVDWYFFDTTTNKYAYWGGYVDSRKNHTCGAGRLISSRLLNEWHFMPWEIRHSKILDSSMQGKLKVTPHTSEIFSLKEHNVYAFDLKSSVNMTPFELWPNTNYINDPVAKSVLNRCICAE